jgi:hypothetical protein
MNKLEKLFEITLQGLLIMGTLYCMLSASGLSNKEIVDLVQGKTPVTAPKTKEPSPTDKAEPSSSVKETSPVSEEAKP